MKTTKIFISTLSAISIAMVLLFLSSCEKEYIGDEPVLATETELNVYVEDGVFHIEGKNTRDYELKVANMSEQEFRDWEAQMGFSSYRTHINTIINELARAADVEERDAIITKYNDFLRIDDGKLGPKVADDFYTSFMNKDGVFYQNGTMVKVFSDYKLFSEKTDLRNVVDKPTLKSFDVSDDIKVVPWGPVSRKRNGIIDVPSSRLKSFGEGPTSPTCAGAYSSDMVSWQYDPRFNGKDRRVELEMSIYRVVDPAGDGDYHYWYRAKIEVRSYKRHWIGSDWDPYPSNLEFIEGEYRASGPDVVGQANDESIWNFRTYEKENLREAENNLPVLSEMWYVGETVLNDDDLPSNPTFCNFGVLGRSSLNTTWLEIDH